MKLNIILRICAIVSVIIFLTYSYNKVPIVTHGFTAYYTFSRMLLEADDISQSYDTVYFNKKINEYGIHNIYDVQYNIPATSFVYLPVAWLQPQNAKIVWGIISILFYIFSSVMLLKIYDIKLLGNPGLILMTIIFLWHPIYENIALGQMFGLLLFLLVLSLLGLKKKNVILTSITLTLSILSKGYGIILYLWLLVSKRYKIFILSFMLVLLVIVLTIPLIHISSWESFYKLLGTSLGRSDYDSNVAYQSVNGFIRHLFIYNKELNPNALFNLPNNYILFLTLIINLVIIVILLFKSKEHSNYNHLNLLSFSALIAASVVTAPIAEEYHYVLMLPLAVGLTGILFCKKNSLTNITKNDSKNNADSIIKKILFIISILLIAIPLRYKTLQLSEFPVYLLAYPKLYGGLIMLGLFYTSFVKNKNVRRNSSGNLQSSLE